MFDGCPYCAQAGKWIQELREEDPAYNAVVIDKVDENLHPDFPREKKLNYYYVPTFFLLNEDGSVGEKLHEGAATKEKIKAVLDAALTKEA